MDETNDAAGAGPGSSEPEGGTSRLRIWLIALVAGLVAWVVLGLVVLGWQPSRFIQIVLIAGVAGAALVFPGSVLRRAGSSICALGLVVGMLYLPSWLFSSEVEFDVRGTARGAQGMFLVHTSYGAKRADDPGETFRNQDAPLSWKVNSSDWQGVLETLAGRRVRARVIGVRFADESVYRNILSVEALDR
jgi:hypothetical protein